MAYDEDLGKRIRGLVGDMPGLVEKKMFGGVGFLINGNMAAGVHKNSTIVRVGAERYGDALAKPHAREFDMTGRAMIGWVMVDPDGVQTDEELDAWIQQGIEFALTLPAK